MPGPLSLIPPPPKQFSKHPETRFARPPQHLPPPGGSLPGHQKTASKAHRTCDDTSSITIQQIQERSQGNTSGLLGTNDIIARLPLERSSGNTRSLLGANDIIAPLALERFSGNTRSLLGTNDIIAPLALERSLGNTLEPWRERQCGLHPLSECSPHILYIMYRERASPSPMQGSYFTRPR